jgi:hypothetical protein
MANGSYIDCSLARNLTNEVRALPTKLSALILCYQRTTSGVSAVSSAGLTVDASCFIKCADVGGLLSSFVPAAIVTVFFTVEALDAAASSFVSVIFYDSWYLPGVIYSYSSFGRKIKRDRAERGREANSVVQCVVVGQTCGCRVTTIQRLSYFICVWFGFGECTPTIFLIYRAVSRATGTRNEAQQWGNGTW